MIEVLGGVLGGLGLFFVGMWMLTENLKTLVGWRLRMLAVRCASNRFAALAWGVLGGAVTQTMSGLTFIVVGMLKSGLVSSRQAFPILVGGNVGVTTVVLIVTLDMELIALYVLGLAGAGVVIERAARYRPTAAALFGAALMFVGLAMVKDAVAPISDQAWFGDVLISAADSLWFSFMVGAFLTFVLQSSVPVCLFGIALATVGALTVDQIIMFIYGSCLGSGLILWLLSANLAGLSRHVAMFEVHLNFLTCLILVPLLYAELYFDVPLMKAAVLAIDLDLAHQMAILFILLNFPAGLILFAGVNPTARLYARLWPETAAERMARPRYIHDSALIDFDTSLALADLEQRSVLSMFSGYLDSVRHEKDVKEVRTATGAVISRIDEFLAAARARHPDGGVEAANAMLGRQKLIVWLEEQFATLCETLNLLPTRSAAGPLRSGLVEGIDAVMLVLLDASRTSDSEYRSYASSLTGDRSALMRRMRSTYLGKDMGLDEAERANVLKITNTVEQTFFLLSKLAHEMEYPPFHPAVGGEEGRSRPAPPAAVP